MSSDFSEFKQAAVDYKTRIAGRFILVEGTKIASSIAGKDICVTRKVDGLMQLVFLHEDKAFMVGSRGVVIEKMACLDEFAAQLKAAGFKSATVACELYVPVSKGRPRSHDVNTALADETLTGKLRLAPFDIVELEGKPFQSDHYSKVQEKLHEIFKSDAVLPVEMRRVVSAQEVEAIYAEWVGEEGAEGLVVRSEMPMVWKVKPRHTVDVAIVGYVTNETGLRSLLFAVRREGGEYQIFGSTSNGLSDDEKADILLKLEPSQVESAFIQTDSRGVAYRFVRPELVVEVSFAELLAETNAGQIRMNPVLSYDERTGWSPLGMEPGVAVLHPVVEGLRPDKTTDPVAIRVSQLSDICPFAEGGGMITGNLPKSELLSRSVYRKISGDKTMLHKFLVWKTNKEQTGEFPAYVFLHTDYSSGRKEFLKRNLRVSSSQEQIFAIRDDFVAKNVKKGWKEVN